MSSDPPYQQLGFEFSSSMISSEAPFFQSSMAPQDVTFSFGDPSGGPGGGDFNTQFMGTNAMITSPANQLVWAAPSQDSHHASMSPEEMDDDAYAVAGDSCSTVYSMHPAAVSSLNFFQYGPSDVTIVQPSKMAKLIEEPAHYSWIYDASVAASIHDPHYLTALSGAGFPNPLATAASELSLRLGHRSSPAVTMAHRPDQSSDVSCSGLTHVNSEGFGYGGPQLVKAHAGLVGNGSDDCTREGLQFHPPYGDVGAGDEDLRQVYQQMYERPPHFSQVLFRSRYAHIAQELLNGFVGFLLKEVGESTDSVSGVGSEASLLLSSSTPSSVSSNHLFIPSGDHRRDAADGERWMEAQNLRNDLLKMLQLMDQRCNRCLDDIQTTASKFSSMVEHPGSGGGGIAAPPFAYRAVSVMYRRMKKRITSLIMAAAAAQRTGSIGEPSSQADKERSWESSFIQKHWALQQLRRSDQKSWRPQRGLPEKSVAILKAWMFENFLRPYPKDNEKEMLAARSGLSRSQVSNWFINARVRLWKPMIEEMYEELRSTSGGGEDEHLRSKKVVG